MKKGRGKFNKLNELGCLTHSNWENKKHLTSSGAELMAADITQGGREAWQKEDQLGANSGPTLLLFTARSSAAASDVFCFLFRVKWGQNNCPAYSPRGREGSLMESMWRVPLGGGVLLLLWSWFQLSKARQ
jgi:hypothetical protein